MTDDEIKQLVMDGWHQISAAYRTIARLPEGKTGRQALYEATQKQYIGLKNEQEWAVQNAAWCRNLGEASATDQYLRCYAEREGGLVRVLTPEEFKRYKKFGGGCAR